MTWFRRRDTWTEEDERKARVHRLAAYNGRVGQGIVHSPEYVAKMRREQEWFDADSLDAEELHHSAPWNDVE